MRACENIGWRGNKSQLKGYRRHLAAGGGEDEAKMKISALAASWRNEEPENGMTIWRRRDQPMAAGRRGKLSGESLE